MVVAALFAGMLAYKLLHAGHLEQTAVFYVGVPAVIALTVVLTARTRSATGTIMAVLTVGLALAGPLLGEGIVCLVFAAPLFYLVGLAIGLFADWVGRGRKGVNAVAVPLLVLVALEGAGDTSVIARESVAVASVPATGDVARALAATPSFRPYDSALLRVGFPRPLSVTGTGTRVGDTRVITFTPRVSLGIGARPEPRSMTLRVSASGPGRVVFDVAADTTWTRWVELRSAAFTWDRGVVTVRLAYRRTFDPSWYFGPIQQAAMTEAAAYLARTFG